MTKYSRNGIIRRKMGKTKCRFSRRASGGSRRTQYSRRRSRKSRTYGNAGRVKHSCTKHVGGTMCVSGSVTYSSRWAEIFTDSTDLDTFKQLLTDFPEQKEYGQHILWVDDDGYENKGNSVQAYVKSFFEWLDEKVRPPDGLSEQITIQYDNTPNSINTHPFYNLENEIRGAFFYRQFEYFCAMKEAKRYFEYMLEITRLYIVQLHWLFSLPRETLSLYLSAIVQWKRNDTLFLDHEMTNRPKLDSDLYQTICEIFRLTPANITHESAPYIHLWRYDEDSDYSQSGETVDRIRAPSFYSGDFFAATSFSLAILKQPKALNATNMHIGFELEPYSQVPILFVPYAATIGKYGGYEEYEILLPSGLNNNNHTIPEAIAVENAFKEHGDLPRETITAFRALDDKRINTGIRSCKSVSMWRRGNYPAISMYESPLISFMYSPNKLFADFKVTGM